MTERIIDGPVNLTYCFACCQEPTCLDECAPKRTLSCGLEAHGAPDLADAVWQGIVLRRNDGSHIGVGSMVLFKDRRRFELTVDEFEGEWRAALREFVPGRLYPTQHLLRTFATRQAAITALGRKWRLLFPDDAALAWHDPPAVSSTSRPPTARSPAAARRPAARRQQHGNRRGSEREPRA